MLNEARTNMVFGSLLVELRSEHDGVHVIFRGTSADPAPEQIVSKVFEEARFRARALRAPVALHLDQLEYFNSSTMGAFLQELKKLRVEGQAVRLRFAPMKRWQRIFCEALRMFERPDGLFRVIAVSDGGKA
jgi:hypothetical protein